MGYMNLSIMFSPSLFRCPYDDPMTRLNNSKIETEILEVMMRDLLIPSYIQDEYAWDSLVPDSIKQKFNN